MKVTTTALAEVLLFEPKSYVDARGFFLETFREERYRDAGIDARFVQDNLSHSTKHVLRGLHFQRHQGKLISVVRGEVFDVAVDIRPDSPRFAQWVGSRLSETNHRQLYVPPGFAHGFYVLSDEADVWYKTTDIYRPEEEGGLLWNDTRLAIDWPSSEPLLSDRDGENPRLDELDHSTLITGAELAQSSNS